MDFLPASISSLAAFGAYKEAATSALVVAAAALASRAHYRWNLNQPQSAGESILRDHRRLRNAVWAGAVCALCAIWAGELRSLIFSLAALAASMLIVGKEFISCLIGSIFWIATKPAKIGDVIELRQTKGELIDRAWLHLEILESHSGLRGSKIAKIPLSAVLAEPVFNHSASGQARWVPVVWKTPAQDAWSDLEWIRANAKPLCEPYAREALACGAAFAKERLLAPSQDSFCVELESVGPAEVAIKFSFLATAAQAEQASLALWSAWLERKSARPVPGAPAGCESPLHEPPSSL